MPRHRLASRILRVIRVHQLVASADRVALALSGGPDSVALLWLLKELEQSGDLPGTMAGLIHVNHGLRGGESARDEQFCRALADRLGLPIEIATFDVAGAARAARRSIEATARDIRYQFFPEAAARLGATVVATGHTLDDQAETVLLRLLRGAGSRGLSGIRMRRGAFVRPLLDQPAGRSSSVPARPAARRLARIPPIADLAIPRNRVRHRLLPVIEDIAPGGIVALARFAALAAADERYLLQAAVEAGAAATRGTGEEAWRTRSRLSDRPTGSGCRCTRRLPAAIGRRVVRRALEMVGARGGFAVVARRGGPHAGRRRPAVRPFGPARGQSRQTRNGADIHGFRGSEAPKFRGSRRRPACRNPGFRNRGTEVPVLCRSRARSTCLKPDCGSALARPGGATPDEISAGGDVAVVQASSVMLPLTVRSRRPGDRLQPLGAPGHRKLQDLLVDRKVPRRARDRVPIVVDGRAGLSGSSG